MITQHINSELLQNSSRLDGKYFLNEDATLSRVIERNKERCVELKDIAKVFNPPIFKRQFCSNTENAVKYCQSSDVPNNFEGSGVFINKIQAEKIGACVNKYQTLITGFGTVGNVRLVNELSAGTAFANNVCRVQSNIPEYGLIYAFLASKYGKAQLNKNASGSVVRYIESPGVGKTLVPILPNSLVNKVQQLINEVMQLRVDCNNLLSFAEKQFDSFNDLKYPEALLDVSENSISNIVTYSKKFEISLKAKNYSSRVAKLIDIWNGKKGIQLHDFLVEPFKIGGASVVKRLNSKKFNGVDMISQTDLHQSNPRNFKKVKVERLAESDLANDRLVLFPSVGNGSGEGEIFVRPTLAYKIFEGKLLSGDIGKFRCKSKEDAAYLFIAMKSKAGFRIFRALVYGTQLRRPNWSLLKDINIPVVSDKAQNEIAKITLSAFDKLHLSNVKELEAINIIEQEIESWQK